MAGHHVLQGGEFPEQTDVLEGAGNARGHHLVGLAGGQLGAVEDDLTFFGHVGAGEHVEEGGLARAVGADQTIHLPLADGQGDIRQGREAAKALGDVLRFEQGDHLAASAGAGLPTTSSGRE
jgi:hypothetical protein